MSQVPGESPNQTGKIGGSGHLRLMRLSGLETTSGCRRRRGVECLAMKLTLLLFVLTAFQAALAQTSGTESLVPRPGVTEVQVPFASLKSIATFKVGETADWIFVTDDAVWVAVTKPNSVQRIDPATNRVISKVRLPGEACSGLTIGFGSLWVPLCGKKPSLVRIDASAPCAPTHL
jgi:hypothetical protein